MRRIAIDLTTTLITFTFGVTVALVLHWATSPRKNHEPPFKQSEPYAAQQIDTTDSDKEVVFSDNGHIKLIDHRVQLKSERLRYKIDVSYPEIIVDGLHLHELNRRIKKMATQQYQWPLNPSKADLKYYREKWPDVFNSIDLYYREISASENFLSIYFFGYSYGIGAAHSVQFSFVVNYDLRRRRRIALSDIFQPGSKYRQFISDYCASQFSKNSQFVFDGALAPNSENFKSWNITPDGIRFNFDACSIMSCASGEQTVDIPFADLKPFLSPKSANSLTRH